MRNWAEQYRNRARYTELSFEDGSALRADGLIADEADRSDATPLGSSPRTIWRVSCSRRWLASRPFAQQKATSWLDRLGISPNGARRSRPDARSARCQRLEGMAHLFDLWLPVIDAAHATYDMTETALGDVGIDAGPRHQ